MSFWSGTDIEEQSEAAHQLELERKRQARTIRQLLSTIVSICITIVCNSLICWQVWSYGSSSCTESATDRYMSEMLNVAQQRIDGLADSGVVPAIFVMSDSVELSTPDLWNSTNSQALQWLISMHHAYPNASSFLAANDEGYFWGLHRHGEDYRGMVAQPGGCMSEFELDVQTEPICSIAQCRNSTIVTTVENTTVTNCSWVVSEQPWYTAGVNGTSDCAHAAYSRVAGESGDGYATWTSPYYFEGELVMGVATSINSSAHGTVVLAAELEA